MQLKIADKELLFYKIKNQSIMENIPKLSIEIKDFRAIKTADIILNGITVIAGINGCGKSTISKLLYRTIKTSIDFNRIIGENIFNELWPIRRFMDELVHELEYYRKSDSGNKKELKYERNDLKYKFYQFFNYNSTLDLKEQESRILLIFDILKKEYEELSINIENDKNFHQRFYRITRFFKEEFDKEKNSENINISILLDKIKKIVKDKFNKAYILIDERSIKILDNIIENYFTENINVKNYNVKELGVLMTNRTAKKLSNFLTINKVAYIDTPMIIGVENIEDTDVPHWVDLNSLLENSPKKGKNKNKISDLLKEEIIDGETSYDSNSETFKYKRNDGHVFDLFNCATGLKSFSALQILYNNGFLDDKTLLIIDEPETHLHPEWIVQYARLIVLLHKELKVNFLIGSHSPDMVSAIKYISKKELGRNNNSLNFYFAKEINKYKFEYRHTKTDIEQIFNSFNLSLDKINEYGATEE